MQTTPHNLAQMVDADGIINPSALPELKELVQRYPYFHLARLLLLRLLYQQRDPAFNHELSSAALYLPSRETIFDLVEAEKMVPKQEEEEPIFSGATLARKPNQRIDSTGISVDDDRTESLIDSFLNTLPQDGQQQGRPAVPRRRGHADASVDYISYMLEEEAAMSQAADAAVTTELVTAAPAVDMPRIDASTTSTVLPSMDTIPPASSSPEVTPSVPQAASVHPTPAVQEQSENGLIDKFIQKQGDRRIKLKERKDSEMQKPVLEVDNGQQKGAFTETLARIYIKQGKFEHAIEIIRRLSLKYPKKNRYFADQIRFLEKLLVNQQASKGGNV